LRATVGLLNTQPARYIQQEGQKAKLWL
jgi:hypothetical protein